MLFGFCSFLFLEIDIVDRIYFKEKVFELENGTKSDNPQSYIYLPLMKKNSVLGIITVQSFQKNAYTENHLNILKNIAVYTAIAFANSNSYQTIEKQRMQIDNAFKDLSLSNQKLQIIFDSKTVGVGIADAKGNMIFSNNLLSNMLGYSIDEMLKMNYASFILPEDITDFKDNFGSLQKKTKNQLNLERRYLRKDKTTFWANFAVDTIRGENGAVQMIVGVFSDIEQLKQPLNGYVSKSRARMDREAYLMLICEQ